MEFIIKPSDSKGLTVTDVSSIYLFYFQGKFSCKSDMWSFGVTLWEILTFAREKPLQELCDSDVVENCSHYYRCTNQEQQPQQPLGCPREIYDMMCTCWSREDSARPSFREIHMFLANKNIGYDPDEDGGIYTCATLPLGALPYSN